MLHPHTQRFFQALFGPCQQGFVTLTAIHPQGGRWSPSRHVPLQDSLALHQALADLSRANALGWGCYVGIGLRRADLGRWRRGGRADLLAVPALFADLDGSPEGARLRLSRIEPLPSCLVHSGHGRCSYANAWDNSKREARQRFRGPNERQTGSRNGVHGVT